MTTFEVVTYPLESKPDCPMCKHLQPPKPEKKEEEKKQDIEEEKKQEEKLD